MPVSPSRPRASSRWWRFRCWLVRMVMQPFWTSRLAPLRKSWYASLSQLPCTSVSYFLALIFWIQKTVWQVGYEFCIILPLFLTTSWCTMFRFHLGLDVGNGDGLQSVSRLDAPTSGALVVPLSQAAAEELKGRFATRSVAGHQKNLALRDPQLIHNDQLNISCTWQGN